MARWSPCLRSADRHTEKAIVTSLWSASSAPLWRLPPSSRLAPWWVHSEPSARACSAPRCSHSARVAARGGLLRDLVLGDDRFQPRDVFQQALAGQDQEIIAELRVLKVDLEQLLIGDGQDVASLRALDGRRSPVVRRKEAEFAHQPPRRQRDADFLDQKVSGKRQEHLVRDIVLFADDIAFAIFSLGHEWFQPFH